MIAAFAVSGCAPPEPEAPATNAAAAPPNAAEPAQPPATEKVEQQAVEAAQPPAADPTKNAANEGPQLVPPQNERPEPIVQTEEGEPQGRTAFYRVDAAPAEIPPVVLSKGHAALCRVKVGDAMPQIELPQLGRDGARKQPADFFGEKATVVVFWNSDRRMAMEQLADMKPDVVLPFGDQGVDVVGIAVTDSPQRAREALQEAGADFPNLLDADGRAFAQVGSEKLPRTYLLDPQGKVLWFDIEYSHATRRELHQALRAVTAPR